MELFEADQSPVEVFVTDQSAVESAEASTVTAFVDDIEETVELVAAVTVAIDQSALVEDVQSLATMPGVAALDGTTAVSLTLPGMA